MNFFSFNKRANGEGKFFQTVFGMIILSVFFSAILYSGYFPLSVKSDNGFRRLKENENGEIITGEFDKVAGSARINLHSVKPIDFDLSYQQEIARSSSDTKLSSGRLATMGKIPSLSPSRKPSKTSKPYSKRPTTFVASKKPSKGPTLSPVAKPRKSPTRYPTFAPAKDIVYHSPGPVMLGTIKVYHIFYGDFSSKSGQTTISLMNYFASHIGTSDWYNIMTAYYDSTGTHCSTSVTYGGSVYLATNATSGTLTDALVQSTVKNAIKAGSFPLDSNGVYFFIFRGSLTLVGFLTSWCGFHSSFTYNNKYLKYSVIGDPSTASDGAGCEAITSNTANGNVGADSMASVYAHELVEAVSDPFFNAWYFSNGYENADECAWTFGDKLPGSTNANVKVGRKTWYIQRNWQPKYGCLLAKV